MNVPKIIGLTAVVSSALTSLAYVVGIRSRHIQASPDTAQPNILSNAQALVESARNTRPSSLSSQTDWASLLRRYRPRPDSRLYLYLRSLGSLPLSTIDELYEELDFLKQIDVVTQTLNQVKAQRSPWQRFWIRVKDWCFTRLLRLPMWAQTRLPPSLFLTAWSILHENSESIELPLPQKNLKE